jgi:hypothetical protein
MLVLIVNPKKVDLAATTIQALSANLELTERMIFHEGAGRMTPIARSPTRDGPNLSRR